MDKVNAKMVRDAEAEFHAYCKKHGYMGKVQEALQSVLLELKKAYAIRKAEIRHRFDDKDIVKFYEKDNWNSFAAFILLYNNVWHLVTEVVIAHEDDNEKDLDIALHNAAAEKRINLGKLVALLK